MQPVRPHIDPAAPGAVALWWVRLDLRLADNPAFSAAATAVAAGAVIPVFIWAPEEEAPWAPGAASRWWLHHSLAALAEALERRGSRLILRRGPAAGALEQLVDETGAGAVFWNRRYEPAVRARDEQIEARLRARGIHAESFDGNLLFDPTAARTTQGRPYQVFTPYYRALLAGAEPPPPLAAPRRLRAPEAWPESMPLAALGLLPAIDWAAGLRAAWQPGEAAARARLRYWMRERLEAYDYTRDLPGDELGTSRLSPHLHFGELSAREAWHAARANGTDLGAPAWMRQLAWREFAHHLLVHFPHTAEAPLRAEFARFPWAEDPGALRAWQRGHTGYPIVDAGMRELWASGWMHNRVRMIVGSLLVKDLRLHWLEGARWFWETLVDADLANNTLGWQWVAGCGADAAPYFRVFNPALQSRKFDAEGEYLRRWLPELAGLSNTAIHELWKTRGGDAPARARGIGPDYPRPIVSHERARIEALAAYEAMRGKRAREG